MVVETASVATSSRTKEKKKKPTARDKLGASQAFVHEASKVEHCELLALKSLISGITVAMTLSLNCADWYTQDDLDNKYPDHDALKGHCGMELIFCGIPSGKMSSATGIGRALGVTMRWHMASKISILHDDAQKAKWSDEQDNTKCDWLKFLGQGNLIDNVYLCVDKAEHLKETIEEGTNKTVMVHDPVSNVLDEKPSIQDAADCAVKVIRGFVLQRNTTNRRGGYKLLHDLFFFLLFNIWNFEGKRDAAKNGHFYSFGNAKTKGEEAFKGTMSTLVTVEDAVQEVSKVKIGDLYDAETGAAHLTPGKPNCNSVRFVNMCTQSDRFIVWMKYDRHVVRAGSQGKALGKRKRSEVIEESSDPKPSNEKTVDSAECTLTVSSFLHQIANNSSDGSVSNTTAAENPENGQSTAGGKATITQASMDCVRKLLAINPNLLVGQVPEVPEKESKEVRIDLHVLALQLLTNIDRLSDVNETLAAHTKSLKAVRAIALGLSGLIREALKANVSLPEQKAKGSLVVGKIVKDPQSSLFVTDDDGNVKPLDTRDTPMYISFDKWLIEYVKKHHEASSTSAVTPRRSAKKGRTQTLTFN